MGGVGGGKGALDGKVQEKEKNETEGQEKKKNVSDARGRSIVITLNHVKYLDYNIGSL